MDFASLKNSPLTSIDLKVIDSAVHLSIIEVAIGSLVHGFRVPFGGHLLSLNQGAFLCQTVKVQNSRRVAFRSVLEISVVAAIMKSLSPIGSRLGPMMSISMQGCLFGGGVSVFGTNIFGQIFGMLLLSLWAFAQPLVSYFLIYGSDLVGAAAYYHQKVLSIGVSDSMLVTLLATVIAFKVTLAILIPFLIRRIKVEDWHFFQDRISGIASKAKLSTEVKKTRSDATWKKVLTDLTRPVFLLSIVFILLFFILTEPTKVVVFWKLLRVLAVATLLFYLTGSQWVRRQILRFAMKSKWTQRLMRLAMASHLRLNAVLKK